MVLPAECYCLFPGILVRVIIKLDVQQISTHGEKNEQEGNVLRHCVFHRRKVDRKPAQTGHRTEIL